MTAFLFTLPAAEDVASQPARSWRAPPVEWSSSIIIIIVIQARCTGRGRGMSAQGHMIFAAHNLIFL